MSQSDEVKYIGINRVEGMVYWRRQHGDWTAVPERKTEIGETWWPSLVIGKPEKYLDIITRISNALMEVIDINNPNTPSHLVEACQLGMSLKLGTEDVVDVHVDPENPDQGRINRRIGYAAEPGFAHNWPSVPHGPLP